MKKLRAIALGAVFVVLLVGGYAAYRSYVVVEPLPEGLLQANGRIEGDSTLVASKLPGRITQVLAQEGEAVTAGQVLVILDDAQIRARLAQAEHALAAARAQVESVRNQAAQAGRDSARFTALLEDGTATRRESEQAQLASRVALEAVTMAREQAERLFQVREEALSASSELTIAAPADGVVTSRIHEPGEVVAAGSPILSTVNLDRLYLKVYVPESQIGQVRLGLPARVHLDSQRAEGLPATVTYISSRAEFTPKEVQTADERAKLVFAVKLSLTANPDHRAVPGLPADAVIRWREQVAWQSPR